MSGAVLPVAFAGLLSHWRRHPGQLATLIIGLALATALWCGVQAINAEARASYAQAEQMMAQGQYDLVVARDGRDFDQSDYIALQRNGWRTSPVVEGRYALGDRRMRVVGVDIITTPVSRLAGAFTTGQQTDDETRPTLGDFISGDGLLLVSPETLEELKGVALPVPVRASKSVAPGLLLADIGLAQSLLKKTGKVSRLIVLPEQSAVQKPLAQLAPHLVVQPPDRQTDPARLTDSFHLNLTAFGFLSFAVGLFIVHGAISLAFEQRRGVFRTLRVMGLSAGRLTFVLAVELLTLASVAGLLGVLLGYFIAASLLPDVAATLRGLYGADVSGSLAFRPQWWLTGLGIAIAGASAAAAASLYRVWKLPVLASAQPRAWAVSTGNALRNQVLFSLALFACAFLLLQAASGLVAAFATVGLFLVGSALLLPPFLALVLRFAERLAKGAVTQWFWADTRQQLRGLSLALMALLLALSANIGVGSMVGSFRTTFTGWLDQRLAAEVYLRARSEDQAAELRRWLESRSDAVLPVWNVATRINGVEGELYGVADHVTYTENWPLLSGTSSVWKDIAAGTAVLINEQLALRQKLSVGDEISVAGQHRLPVAGIYSDYGNPAPQAMVGVELLIKWFPDVPRLRYAVRVDPDKADALVADVQQKFELSGDYIVQQDRIKKFSVSVFERTFAVTDALNVLTLAIAGFAIFTSLLTLATMRLPQLAPTWALGLTRRRLAVLEVARAVILAMSTLLVALPIGLALAWLLLKQVNVEAFGWELPLFLFPADWLRLGFFALVAAGLAALLPARRLATIAPADLIKVFTHER